MARDKRPSRKDLTKLLTESAFDPRADGPLAVVVDMRDPDYCELKAIELVTEARRCFRAADVHEDREMVYRQYHDRLAQAIGLLGLARLQRGEGGQ